MSAVSEQDKDRWYSAIRYQKLDVLEEMVKKGIDVNVEFIYEPNDYARYRVTGLWYACKQGKPKIVEFLLQQPGIAFIRDRGFKKTPLEIAQQENEHECVRLLENFEEEAKKAVDEGMKPVNDALQKMSSSPIDETKFEDVVEFVKKFFGDPSSSICSILEAIERFKIEEFKNEEEALNAVCSGAIRAIFAHGYEGKDLKGFFHSIFKRGLEVNEEIQDGVGILELAVSAGPKHPEAIPILAGLGVCPRSRLVCSEDRCLYDLLDAADDLDEEAKKAKRNALMELGIYRKNSKLMQKAIKEGNIENAMKALAEGADPNEVSELELSGDEVPVLAQCLYWNSPRVSDKLECSEARFRIFELLLEHGANPNFYNFMGDEEAEPLLAKVWGMFFPQTHPKETPGFLRAVKLMVSKGADVNLGSHSSAPPLHSAVAWGNLEGVKLLLDLGADPNLRDYKGLRPVEVERHNTNTHSNGLAIMELLLKPQQVAASSSN